MTTKMPQISSHARGLIEKLGSKAAGLRVAMQNYNDRMYQEVIGAFTPLVEVQLVHISKHLSTTVQH
jgi:hypothetical protein